MDIQSVASQLMGYLGNNPDLISQFVAHPYSTTAAATGTDDTISKDDTSQIVTQLAAQATGQSVPAADVSSIASSLLGQNGGSVHALTGALFGGSSNGNASSLADIAVKSLIGGIAARGAASLISGALGGKKK
ncbi:MAG: hypothetical protein IKG22_07890 [Atopobiaceae bacterium]|nr:hypothetical protein [Atopobiaceae bacterium]